MNASPLASPRPSPDTASLSTRVPARKRSLRSLLGTLTGICFVFGALVAIQVRTITNLEKSRVQKTQNDVQQKELAEKYRVAAEKNASLAAAKNTMLIATVAKLKDQGNLSETQIKSLTTQIKSLQVQACLTPMTGQGISIVLSDNPQAAQAGGNPSLPLPGLVHDYDVLQVVNELRAAKADGIAVHGAGGRVIRITGTSPIRCVGPVIYINWNAVAAPFTIEAVGEAKTLQSAITMPGGIVENLQTQGAVGVKVTTQNSMTLPPADGVMGSASTTDVVATTSVPTAKSKGL